MVKIKIGWLWGWILKPQFVFTPYLYLLRRNFCMSLLGVVETFMRNWMEKDHQDHLYGQFSIQFSFCMPKKKVLIGFP